MSDPLELRITSTRAELESTLDAIEDRLNLPKRLSRLKVRARHSFDTNPLPWVAAATAAVVTIGALVAWALVTDD